MIKFLKNKASILLFTAFLISIAPFLSKLFVSAEPLSSNGEQFDSKFLNINSIDKVIKHVDSIYNIQKTQILDTAAYVAILNNFIRDRFYHGSLNYRFSENWIANLSGKVFWSHLSSIVVTNDILKHSHGLCSQQTMVFMEILRRKKINLRSVGLGYKEGPGHFLCEVHYDNSWHLHDVSLEPNWGKIVEQHNSMSYYLNNKDTLFLAYESKISKETFEKILEKIEYGKVNELPAKNMTFFHELTLYTTCFLPIALLFLFIRSYRRKMVEKQN